jgi:hypothetical protein
LRKEHRQRLLENRVLRKILGPKRYGVTGKWRKPHGEELTDLYTSPNTFRVITSRRMEMAWTCSTISGEEWFIQGLVGKPVGKKPI